MYLAGQPVADFSANVTSGCAPVVVSFQDLSSGAVAWLWDTGNGTSTLQSPSIFYQTPGTYTVSLTVTDASGAQHTKVRTAYIQVYAYPEADFSASAVSVCTHTAISFSSSGSQPGSGSLTGYTWDFGDGSTSHVAHPVHSYSEPGVYPVSLLVSNSHGCTDNKLVANFVTVHAPDASFTASQTISCGPPLPVQFTSLGTTTGTHSWDFGDGATAGTVHPSHTYLGYGSFGVRHVVTDAMGCRDTVLRSNYINVGVNTLGVEASDSSICENDTVFFYTNASPNSTVVWDFGDGTSGTGLHPYRRYTTPGNYTATATISDPGGCSAVRSVPVTVHAYPVVDFGVADTTLGCEVPFTVQFVNLTTGAQSYTWQIESQGNYYTYAPAVTFTTVDSFRVTLLAHGPGGCNRVRRKSNYIQIRRTDNGFVADPRGGCAPLPVSFTDTTHSAYPLSQWWWNFGDGQTSTQQHPQHTYADTGRYDVRLITQNQRGCRDTLLKQHYVKAGDLPTAAFAVDTNRACALAPVQFINQSVGAQSFLWVFEDGDTAMSAHPSHGFAALGWMDVMLIASDRGCKDTAILHDLVEVLEPLPVIGISEKKVCQLPRDVVFQNLSIGDDTWSWLLDGTTPYSSSSFIHTFTQEGEHGVTLTVSNFTTGCTVTTRDSVFIRQVIAAMEPDTNRACKPRRIYFTDQSYNAVKWRWHFGTTSAADTSILQHPSFNYRNTGNYPVTLMVENELGCRDTLVYDHIAMLGVKAQIGLAGQPNGCVPLDIALQDASTGTGPVASWFWHLGDGTTSTQQHPQHTYASPNQYTVSLKVVDVDGCVDSVKKTNFIYATQPVANFVVSPSVDCPDFAQTFLSLSTGAGLSYLWDFGDSTTSTLANTTHVYPGIGTYDVRLTVTDVNGCDSSMALPQAVTIQELHAQFWADTTFAHCPPLAVQFGSDTSFAHEGIVWEWDFGNGATSGQPFPTHVYTQPGTYTVRLVLRTPTGCTDTMVIEDFIHIEGPTGDFVLTPDAGCPGLEVSFTAQSADTVSYEWVFGDGLTGQGQHTTHVYHQPGVYVPVLVIEDTRGCRVYNDAPDTLVIHEPPVADFTSGKSVLCDGGTIDFLDQSQSASLLGAWYWDFGDGGTAQGTAVSHAYAATGAYDVRLIVENTHGCRDTADRPAYVLIVPSPRPVITLGDTVGCAPLQLAATGSVPGHAASILSWDWSSAPESVTAQGQSVGLSWNTPGQHLLTLTVSDAYGCTGQATQRVEVYPIPTVDFVATDSFGCAPFPVRFIVHSPDSLVRWFWDFGDGGTSEQPTAGHTYWQDGVYTVSMRVWDEHGCTHTAVKDDYIHLAHPTADFAIDDRLICPGSDLVLTDRSRSDTTLVRWTWDFGDGQTSQSPSPQYSYAAPGYYDLQLIVGDVFGCTDTLLLPAYVHVLANDQPAPLPLDYVSVAGRSHIDLQYAPYPASRDDFGAYHILRSRDGGPFAEVGVIKDRTQLHFADEGLDTEGSVYCYKVVATNYCDLPGDEAATDAHCAINVQTQAMVEQVNIDWTPYVGWSAVDNYHIYRVGDYGNSRSLLATVPGTVTSYTDWDMFCYEDYAYRIEAVGLYHLSQSDTAFADPIHLAPQQASHIVQVSVEDNARITLSWEAAQIDDPVEIVVERNDGLGFREYYRQAARTGNSKHKDTTALVGERAYAYRVFSVDTCGDRTPLGRPGNSIFLQGERQDASARLAWTAYEGWEQGVEAYEIEVYNEATGSFEQVARLAGSETSYTDEKTQFNQPLYCYRVTAHEAGGTRTFSLSNEACVVPLPRFYTANAFTPNGDGINDAFRIEGLFLESYELTIYNRWGIKIFESNNIEQPWRGENLRGGTSPEGVYMFVARGRGHGGESIQRAGSVTLIR
ncbi:MAG: hypothetical protein OHK0039_29670 [Bacteroidia bacterium]